MATSDTSSGEERHRAPADASTASRTGGPAGFSGAGWHQLLFEQSPNGIVVYDTDCVTVDCNAEFLRMMRTTRERVIGVNARDVRDQGPYRALQRALTGEVVDYEAWYEATTSDARFLSRAIASPFRDADGRIVGAILVLEDHTAEAEAEASLRARAARVRSAFDNAFVGMALTRPDGVFTRVNRALCRMLGYDAHELAGKTFAQITHPDDVLRSVDLQGDVLEGRLEAFETEKRYLHRDGHTVWVHLMVGAVRDDNGQIAYFITQVHDISEQREAVRALSESEGRYRMIVQEASDGIVRFDPDTGDVEFANPAMYHMLGVPEEPGRIRNVREVLTDDPDTPLEARVALLRSGESLVAERRLRRADGTFIVAEVSSRMIGPRVQSIVRDVTQRRRMEEQLRQAQKMNAVGQLAAGVSHDFNNLLTVIGTHADLLLERLASGQQERDDVRQIRQAADRAASLTHELLAFSSQQVLAPRLMDLNLAVRELEPMLGRIVRENVRVALSLAPDLHTMRADRGQVEHVLVNLAMNARDAMPDGGELRIETGNVHFDGPTLASSVTIPAGDYVRLAVRDTGLGMDTATRARIFEPFFTTKEAGRGTGLGLAAVYGIVQQSGGYITVYSEPGVGTTFSLYFPRAAQPAPAPPPAESGRELRGSETVLLVEDEPAVRAVALRVLQRLGYQVLVASNGEEALGISASHAGRIDAVVTDAIMPGLTGPETARRLVAERPGLRVVYMSGYTDDEILRRGELEPGAVFVQKPFSVQTLAKALRDVLDVRQA